MIQSPAQLRALYGPDVTEEILTNCGLEVVFAPKELKVAQDLSERLGYYTYRARSRSRPSGLAAGRRSLTESDQRRALMLPQELMQLPADKLIVLKAGLPPVRARKIVYYRERAFVDRLRPAPVISPAPRTTTPPLPSPADPRLDFDSLALALAAEGLAPPPAGASEGAFGDWIDKMIDTAAPPAADLVEARDR